MIMNGFRLEVMYIDGEALETLMVIFQMSDLSWNAEFNDGNANDAGHVRVYQLDVNGDWAQYGDDIDGVDADHNFGWISLISGKNLPLVQMLMECKQNYVGL